MFEIKILLRVEKRYIYYRKFTFLHLAIGSCYMMQWAKMYKNG